MPLFGPPNIEKMKANRDIAGLIKALEYEKDANISSAAAAALGELGDQRAVDALIGALRSRSVAETAARSLGMLGDQRAVEPLVWIIGDGSNSTKLIIAAAWALGKLKDSQAIGSLLGLWRPANLQSWGTNNAAKEALIAIGEPAIQPLLARFQNGDENERREIVSMLQTMGWIPDKSEVAAWYWMVISDWDKCIQIGEPAVAALASALLHGVNRIPEQAADALIEIGGMQAMEILCAALVQVSASTRSVLETRLVELGPATVDLFLAILEGNNLHARAGAAILLGKKGEARAMAPLLRLLQEASVYARIAAVQALGFLGTAMPGMEALGLALGDKNKEVQQAAASALKKIGKSAIPMILAAMEKLGREDQKTAQKILAELGWEPGKDEGGAWYWIHHDEIEKCLEIGKPAVVPLISVLENRKIKEETRADAARLLGQIGDARAVEPLCVALKDNARRVRIYAMLALGKLGDPRAIEALIPMLDRSQDAGPGYAGGLSTSAIAANALAGIGGPLAIEALLSKLHDEKCTNRVQIAHALGETRDSKAVTGLIKTLLEDKDHEVSSEAAQALGKLCEGQSNGSLAVDPLLRIIQDEKSSDRTRIYAIQALGDIGDRRASPVVLGVLQTVESSIKADATGLLGHSRSAHGSLSVGISNPTSKLCAAAANTLGKIGDGRSIPALIELLRWGSGPVHEVAVRKEAGQALVKLYQSETLSQEEKRTILTQRDRITRTHEDQHLDRTHDDLPPGCYITGSETHDDSAHTDNGIGVEFPL